MLVVVAANAVRQPPLALPLALHSYRHRYTVLSPLPSHLPVSRLSSNDGSSCAFSRREAVAQLILTLLWDSPCGPPCLLHSRIKCRRSRSRGTRHKIQVNRAQDRYTTETGTPEHRNTNRNRFLLLYFFSCSYCVCVYLLTYLCQIVKKKR